MKKKILVVLFVMAVLLPLFAGEGKTEELNVSLDFGVKGKFVYYKNETGLFPSAKCSLTYTLYDIVYLENSLEGLFYKGGDNVYITAFAGVDLGVKADLGYLYLFGYGGIKYVFAEEDSGFTLGPLLTAGCGIGTDLAHNVTLKASYERLGNANFYNLTAGLKF